VGEGLAAYIWTAIGILGGLVFYGRFYVQWIASELKKRSVMPIAFWYMSGAGSVMLLSFAVWSQSPLGALGQNLNLVIYARNLVHIWREQGRLSPRRSVLVHGCVAAAAAVALAFVAFTWYREYEITQSATTEDARTTWMWLAVGVVGQGLFAARFLIQWIATEKKRKSVIPNIFWYLSVVAAAFQCASFVQRAEWVFAAGMIATILIYLRNLWFIYLQPAKAEMLISKN